MNESSEKIAESKQRERKRLAALPFAEKLKILEQLRNREAAILASRPMPVHARLADKLMLVQEYQAAYGSASSHQEQTKGGGD